jgi:hypothetical protein
MLLISDILIKKATKKLLCVFKGLANSLKLQGFFSVDIILKKPYINNIVNERKNT